MKKYCLDLTVKSVEHINEKYVLLKLTDENPLPEMIPGQFVEIQVDGSKTTFLRRPISINDVDRKDNTLHLLIACIGDGTRQLGTLTVGAKVNIVLPLGNGFTMPTEQKKVLLVGGGVGVAPLLYFGNQLKDRGMEPTFLLGARSAKDLLMQEEFEKYGRVFVTTEDGTAGEKGFVTQHSLLQKESFDQISTCGPKPMMVAVARFARKEGVFCEASLENLMYVLSSGASWFQVSISRALLAVPGHFAFAVAMGYYYSLNHFYGESAPAGTRANILVIPILLHGVYDTLAFWSGVNEYISGLITLGLLYFCFRLFKATRARIQAEATTDNDRYKILRDADSRDNRPDEQ